MVYMRFLLIFFFIAYLCQSIDPPGAISLLDPHGNPIADVSLIIKENSGVYTFSCIVEQGDWTISPSLPHGLLFRPTSASFSGEPSSLSEKQQYNVTVTNSAGTSSLLFTLEVIECTQGYYIRRAVSGFNAGHITLSRGSTVLEDIDYASYLREAYFCIPKGEVTFFMNCTYTTTHCAGYLTTTDGMHYLSISVANGESTSATTFMQETQAPLITVSQPDILLTVQQSFSLSFTVSGIYSDVVFSPSLPSSLSYDSDLNLLKGDVDAKGVYAFTATTSNSLGSSSVVFTLYVDTCPEGFILGKLQCAKGKEDVYTIKKLSGEIVESDSIDYFYRHNVCLVPGEYWMEMTSKESSLPWENPLLLMDEDGTIMEQFQKTSGQLQSERFVIGDIVRNGSTFKMFASQSIDPKWNSIKYRDLDWVERSSGTWGTCALNTPVYFRRVISIDNPFQYAHIMIELTAKDSTEIYLNEKRVYLFSSQDSIQKTVGFIPITFLQKGVNLLAARQTCSEGPIQFDLRLHLSTSFCVFPQASARISDDQPQPDPQHPAADAFRDAYSWWNSTIPVNLSYATDYTIVPSQVSVSIPSHATAVPKNIKIIGQLIWNNQVVYADEIASVQRQSLFVATNTELIKLASTRPYNTLVFHISDSSNHVLFQMNQVQIGYCQRSTCSKKIGLPQTQVGSGIAKSCPLGTYGQRYRRCSRSDVTPSWTIDDTMCISKYSQKGWAYVDTRFSIYGMRASQQQALLSFLQQLIPAHLTVWAEQISVPVWVERLDSEPVSETVVRFSVEQDIGDYVVKKMIVYVQACVEEIQKEFGVIVILTESPTLYLPFPWVMILIVTCVIVIVIVAFVLGAILAILYLRASKKSNNKQLFKKISLFSKDFEKESLLVE